MDEGQEDFAKYEYVVLERVEGDDTATRIEKRNIKADFNLAEMRSQQLKCEKIVKELTGTLALEESKSANIREHHPHVAEMDMQQLFAAKRITKARHWCSSFQKRLRKCRTR